MPVKQRVSGSSPLRPARIPWRGIALVTHNHGPIEEPREFCGHPRVTDGKPCRRRPVTGGVVCPVHGGEVGATKRAAADRRNRAEVQRRMERQLLKEGYPTIDSAIDELEKIAAEAIVFKNICQQRINELLERNEKFGYEGRAGEQLRSEVAVYERALDRCNKVLVDHVRLGIAERKQKLDEQQAVLLVGVIKAILNQLDLTRDQKKLAGEVVPRELRAIEGKVEKG